MYPNSVAESVFRTNLWKTFLPGVNLRTTKIRTTEPIIAITNDCKATSGLGVDKKMLPNKAPAPKIPAIPNPGIIKTSATSKPNPTMKSNTASHPETPDKMPPPK